jgi:hypothetical protein
MIIIRNNRNPRFALPYTYSVIRFRDMDSAHPVKFRQQFRAERLHPDFHARGQRMLDAPVGVAVNTQLLGARRHSVSALEIKDSRPSLFPGETISSDSAKWIRRTR